MSPRKTPCSESYWQTKQCYGTVMMRHLVLCSECNGIWLFLSAALALLFRLYYCTPSFPQHKECAHSDSSVMDFGSLKYLMDEGSPHA